MPNREPAGPKPLTAAQAGVWAAQQSDPGSPRYNCGGWTELRGRVDESALVGAVRQALGEAECLRVWLDDAQGSGQRTAPVPAAPLDLLDLRDAADPQDAAEQWMRADMSQAPALIGAPLIRHALIRTGESRYSFYLRYHHVLMDGFGQSLYLRRIADIYSALVKGVDIPAARSHSLPELLADEAAYRDSPAFPRDRAFWLGRFDADEPEGAVSLSDRRSAPDRGLLRHAADLDRMDVDRLREAAAGLRTSPSVLLIAAVAAYQARITGRRRSLLNLPVPARLTRSQRNTPAMLANELPVQYTVESGSSYADLVTQIGATLDAVLKHQRYRGEDLHRELGLAGSGRRLAGTTVNVLAFDADPVFAGLESSVHHLSSGPVHDLRFDFVTDAWASRVRMTADANPSMYTGGVLAAHGARLLNLLRDALRDPDRPVGHLAIMSSAERDAVLAGGRGPSRPYSLDRCLHELVEEQALCTPDALAVQAGDRALTYRELLDRSRALAAHLRECGAGPGDIVGVHGERSLDLVISLLAVLFSGAAYLPLDPDLPSARIAYQIRDSGARIVLACAAPADRFDVPDVEVIAVEKVLPGLSEPRLPVGAATAQDTAYVIYTSGSTGNPKAVAVPHRGIVNRLLWMQDEYGLEPGEGVLQKTPFTFDVSVWEFFWPLLVGARLCLAEPGAHRDPRALARVIERDRISTAHFVPPMLDLFLAEPGAARLPSLRRVICSGEALRPATVARFFELYGADGPQLHNLYGPTEASVDVTHWRCTPQDTAGPIPIGRPVANTSIYVLDDEGEPLPFGVRGELYIGGVQVASGYLGRPDESAARFVPDRLGSQQLSAGRLYRTGDLAALREDGVLEFHGRLDDQLKVRGFRVEPGEIESALRGLAGVGQAVVTATASAGGQIRLIAHAVPAGPGPAPDEADLLAALRATLPEYMVPGRIVLLDALPLTTSGKVDRRALVSGVGDLEPQRAGGSGEPDGEAERLLHDAWAEVLDRGSVDVHDSFFALGGDSILAIRARTALERRGRTFTVSDLFDDPTIRSLAPRTRPSGQPVERGEPFSLLGAADRELLERGGFEHAGLEHGDLEDAYPLTALQTGMLFHTAYETGSSIYRVVTGVRVALRLDEEVLRRALVAVFRRHPALRSSFHLTGFGEPLQFVHREVPIALEISERLRGTAAAEREEYLRGWAEAAKYRDFDPAVAPLLAFTVFPIDAESFELCVVEHHAVLDGWSDAAMIDEIVTRYRAALAGEELWLPEIRCAYRDYVAAERAATRDPGHADFWAGQLAGVEAAPLPRAASHASREREMDVGAPPAREPRRFDVRVDPQVAERLIRLAREAQLPVKALLTAAHASVLHSLSPGTQILTGVVAHGRLDEDGGDETVGLFLNTLPLRLSVAGVAWIDVAREAHAAERRAAAHRRYPYAHILRENPDAGLDSYINVMDFHRRWGADGLILDGFGVAETGFPLAANFLTDPVGGRLSAWLDCDTAALDPDLCERLAGYYERALAALVGDAYAAVDATDLRDAAERGRLRRWNDTALALPELTVDGLIAAQAAATPDATAVLCGDIRLTYAELEAAANQLARYLRSRGAVRGALVGIAVRRSCDLVVALLAAIKSGAAYVPMDPDFPAERLRHIAEDARLDLLVTGPGVAVDGLVADEAVVRLDAERAQIAAWSALPLDSVAGPQDPVYVIYTSGSTGRPKGTVLLHRNAVNFLAGMDERIGVRPGDTVLALTSISFDISVLELLWPLTRGATVAVAGERMIERLTRSQDADSFAELCARYAPALLQATPSFLAAVAAEPEALDALKGLRTLLVGGEAFPAGLAGRLLDALPEARVYNMYGPTETTVWSTVHELDRRHDALGAPPPIGRPIANTVARVAAADGRELPIGAAGELWLGGDGVAREYLRRPELTAERFVRVPGDGSRYYRTGDRVRWRADGVLEFLGRTDRQVKILGHRVEPDEVESVLSRHPGVASVAVVAAPRAAGGHELVAYVEPSRGADAPDAQAARLDHWREVWERAYTETGADDGDPRQVRESHEFAGWLSSYTGEPVPAEEMREWLGHTVDRIRALGARRIVDVGVGVGLVLRELAGDAESYLGLDVSARAVRAAVESVARDGAVPGHVRLREGDALSLADLPDGSADLVLFNSVAQYFPSLDYLTRALTQAVRVAGPTGAVFVGDVRDAALLDAFHADVQLHRAPALTAARAVAANTVQARARERELCVSAGFFHRFAASDGRLGAVRIELKRGRSLNEMTRFRWDVTLLGVAHPALLREWDAAAGATRLADLPDARLARPLAALAELRGGQPEGRTAWDVERALWEAANTDRPHPEDLVELAARAGRAVRLEPAASGIPGRFDAVFTPAPVPTERTADRGRGDD